MTDTLGGARTATEAEITQRLGTSKTDGLYLGRFYGRENDKVGGELPYGGDRHAIVFGPTGSGKTKRLLVPNLTLGLENSSVIVIDPKGELAAMTARHRRSLGHHVVVLNPFDVLGLGSEGFNPLAVLNPKSPTFYDDAAAIGEALIKVEGSEPHWSESAQGLIVALLMWEKLRNGVNANLENVRAMLTEADEWAERVGNDQRQLAGLRVTAAKMAAQGGYEIASLAGRFTNLTDEISSIQSTADTQTRWLLSRPMRADLAKPGIDFGKLKERPTTVYVILPAERLRTHSVWLRLVIVSALRALYRPGPVGTVLFIDEMAALGHLAPLEDAFGLVRGYGIQIVGILQDLPQLQGLYKERWETFIANAGAVFGFAPNDLTTAGWMSDRSGQMTAVVKGFSESHSSSGSGESAGTGATDQQLGRPLFLRHELFGLDVGMGLMWLAGLDKTTTVFAPYYRQIAKCRERVDQSPYDTDRGL